MSSRPPIPPRVRTFPLPVQAPMSDYPCPPVDPESDQTHNGQVAQNPVQTSSDPELTDESIATPVEPERHSPPPPKYVSQLPDTKDVPGKEASQPATSVPQEPEAQEPHLYRDVSLGNLIIRTSDGTEFHIERERIAATAPIFSDVSPFAQPLGYAQPTVPIEKPIIDVVESGAVWEHILHMCHHPPEPLLDYVHVQPLLDAGRKYAIAGLKERVQRVLCQPDFIDERPVSVYALACAYGLPDVARLAARRTLRLGPVFEYVPELAAISGRAYHNLVAYRQQCSIAARTVVARSSTQPVPPWVDESADTLAQLVVCSCEECEKKAQYHYRCETDYHIRPAWLEYLAKVERSLEMRPDGSVATSVEMLEPVVVSAAECVACARKVFAQVMTFSKEVEKRIEDEISKVDLVVDA